MSREEEEISQLKAALFERALAHERTKDLLAAMQRDRDALAAEVRDVDEALRDTGLEHHIPTGQGLNKDTRRLAIECAAACSEQLLERVETLLVEGDALAERVRELVRRNGLMEAANGLLEEMYEEATGGRLAAKRAEWLRDVGGEE